MMVKPRFSPRTQEHWNRSFSDLPDNLSHVGLLYISCKSCMLSLEMQKMVLICVRWCCPLQILYPYRAAESFTNHRKPVCCGSISTRTTLSFYLACIQETMDSDVTVAIDGQHIKHLKKSYYGSLSVEI